MPLSYVKKDPLIGVLQYTTVRLFQKISEILNGSTCIRVLFQKGYKILAWQGLFLYVRPLTIIRTDVQFISKLKTD